MLLIVDLHDILDYRRNLMDQVTKYNCLEKMGASISDPVIWIYYDATKNEVILPPEALFS